MADETFQIGFAVGLQTDIDTVNATTAALSGTVIPAVDLLIKAASGCPWPLKTRPETSRL